MKKTGSLDRVEVAVRAVLGIVLVLIAWDYGWTVVGTGAFVLGVVALVTAAIGASPADKLLGRVAKQ